MSGPILLLGGNGQVGWELRRALAALGPICAPDRNELDLNNFEKLRERVRELQPVLIVNAAAYTAVDAAEDDIAASDRLNAELPALLADEASTLGVPLIHYSTDYVFDGKAPKDERGMARGYHESDLTVPLNTYGRGKLAGEIAAAQARSGYLILRTAWVYSTRRRNFMRTMLRLASERDELRVVADQFGTPTWARLIADVTATTLARCWQLPSGGVHFGRSDIIDVSGTYHLTACGRTSWHGFAEAIVEHAAQTGGLERRPRVTAITTQEYPTPAARPAWSVLDTANLATTFGLAMPDWREQLHLCMDGLPARE